MLILGLASLLQVVLIPGLLVMYLTGTTGGIVRTVLISFALSIVINFYITVVLVSLKLYTGTSMYLIFSAELFSLLFLTRKAMAQPVQRLFAFLGGRCREHTALILERRPRAEQLPALVSLAMIALFLYNYLSAIGSIFDHGDDIVSWNRWAVDWYQGYFPRMTWNYPQLLPANWSMTYVFLNDSRLQFFAKSISPLFSMFMLLALYDLWVRRRDFSFLCAIPVTALLCMVLTGGSMNKGYADMPVAFMSFMSLYVLLAAGEGGSPAERVKTIVIGAVCCAGAALTKQAGLYLLGMYPLFCWLLLPDSPRRAGRLQRAGKTASVYLLLFVLTAPWYLYTAGKIAAGREKSEIRFVTHDIYLGRSMWGRLVDFLAKVKANLDTISGSVSLSQRVSDVLFIAAVVGLVSVCAVLIYFILQSLPDALCRYVLLLVVVPYFCLWAKYFSYDFRNLTLVFPFLGLVVGNGMYRRLRACGSA